ncbi:MAG: HAD-IA family hydrolase [Propionibacteriaceae bacterium]|nr:HAD-IA family hydrolase [Propionibacteriaceae bacterium]
MDSLCPTLAGAEACLFDLDGVLTPTADVHKRAWTQLFGTVFGQYTASPPFTDHDYFTLVDGRPRYDGVRAVLLSRDIHLPDGDPAEPPSTRTVCGMGNLKDSLFLADLDKDGVQPYPGSVRFLQVAMAAGLSVAVVSASKNARHVLRAAGLLDCFDTIVDGRVAADLGLRGKPFPDTYVEAARRLDVAPNRAVVIEDALGGVEAGRVGGFGRVIGVNRGAGAQPLLSHGASLVVDDLAELLVEDRPRRCAQETT